MKGLIKPILIFVAFQVVITMFGRLLRQCYLRQEVGEDEVNAVGVTGGAKEKITTKAFKGGYVRAVMGGVELDLSEAIIETPPATIEAQVVMGGAEIKVPRDWRVKTETQVIMGGVQAMGGREKSSEVTTPDLVITGQVIMGGIDIKPVG
jgi:predicted membrane protein